MIEGNHYNLKKGDVIKIVYTSLSEFELTITRVDDRYWYYDGDRMEKRQNHELLYRMIEGQHSSTILTVEIHRI